MPSEVDQIHTWLSKLPVVTKFLCFTTATVTLSVIVGLSPRYGFGYDYELVVKNYQIWRLLTSYFVGTPKLNLIFELVALYRAVYSMESGPYLRRSSDLAWQTIFACVGIFLATRPLGTGYFFSALLTCLCYLSAETAPIGSTTSFMGLITLPISYLPYCIVFIELLSRGPYGGALAVAGCIVGHLWFWLIWKGRGKIGVLAPWGQASGWFRDCGLFEGDGRGGGRTLNGGGLRREWRAGQEIHIGAQGAASCGTASSAHVWGSGARLGSN
ncbi:endoplasmic reticulum protein [Coprinopsis cinerea AmutBmut pab1-1]|nr:endoplasmic reticulum protein [Coprinopsis cinerea AmutBmut pab1-1]